VECFAASLARALHGGTKEKRGVRIKAEGGRFELQSHQPKGGGVEFKYSDGLRGAKRPAKSVSEAPGQNAAASKKGSDRTPNKRSDLNALVKKGAASTHQRPRLG